MSGGRVEELISFVNPTGWLCKSGPVGSARLDIPTAVAVFEICGIKRGISVNLASRSDHLLTLKPYLKPKFLIVDSIYHCMHTVAEANNYLSEL